MAGSIYQLPTINADTNAGTGAMSGASESFSRAGTVFGELRKSILDEEQRRIENEFKQKQFDENIRQFGETLGLHRDQLSETSRHNMASEALDKARNDITAQHYRWSHEDAMQRNRLSSEQNAEIRAARLATMEQALAERQMKERDKLYMRSVMNFGTLDPQQQTHFLGQLAEAAKKGDSSAAYLVPQLTELMRNPSNNPMEYSQRISTIAAGLSGDTKDLRDIGKELREDYRLRKERDKDIREAQIAADKASASYLPLIHQSQRLDMEGNEALTKKAASEVLGPNHTFTVNTGNIVKQLIDSGKTSNSWLGNGIVLEPNKLLGDFGPTDSMGILHADNSGNDPRYTTLRDLYVGDLMVDGRKATPSERAKIIDWFNRQRNALFFSQRGTMSLPDVEDIDLDY